MSVRGGNGRRGAFFAALRARARLIHLLALRALGVGLLLLMQLAAARQVGAAEYGVYVYVVGWGALLATVASLGQPRVLFRELSIAYAQRRPTRKMWLAVQKRTLVAGLALGGIAAWATACGVFGARQDSAALTALLGLTPVTLLAMSIPSALQATDRVTAAVVLQQVAPALVMLTLLGVAALAGWHLDASLLLLAQVATGLGASCVGALMLWSRLRPTGPDGVDSVFSVTAGVPFWGVDVADVAAQRLGVLLVGSLLTPTVAGHYFIAERLSELVGWGQWGVNQTALQRLARAHASGAREEVASILREGAVASTWIAVPAALALAAVGPWLLASFGAGFVAAYPALLVLACGQVVSALCGPVGGWLVATGHPAVVARWRLWTLSLGCVVGWLATLMGGSFGMALASAATMVVWNLGLRRAVVRRLGVEPTILAALRRNA